MKSIFVTALLLFSVNAFTQTDTSAVDDTPLDQQIENLSENLGTEDADLTVLTENLQRYKEKPLNLNTATREELIDLGLLNDVQINNLLVHREQFGNLISIYEIQAIDGFDLATIYSLLPYVTVTDRFDAGHFSVKEMFANGKHEVTLRSQRVIEEQLGYTPIDSISLAESPNSRYLGNPYRMYARYRFTYSNFVSFGVTAEKDPGEEFFRGTQKNGFDFYSAHLSVRNIGPVKSAVLGDYQVSFGQGLTIWTGYAFGKTSMTVATKRNAVGIRPYTSVDENRFLRGGATTLKFGPVEASAFFSMRKRDANISVTDTIGTDVEILEVSSIQETGYHSTLAEMTDRRSLEEMLYGGNVTFRHSRFHVGVTAIHSEYNKPLVRNLGLYNQFEFSAQKNSVIGADYAFVLRNFNFFGEVARSENGGIATTNGVLISADSRLAFTIHHRFFGKEFQNIYANAFSESTLPVNEQGIYFGFQAKPHRKWTLSAYYDFQLYPWMKYQVDAPSQAFDFLAQVNFTPDKKTDMYFRYRHRDKFTNANDPDADIDYIIPFTQDNIRFNIAYPVGKSWKLKNRIEYVKYYPSDETEQTGLVIYQDVTYKKIGFPVSFTARYALFQTDSYNARVYAYENDMPLQFSVPAYYGKGSRVYLLVNWDITRRFEVWMRVSQWFYYNQNIISEGSLTEIRSNHKTEVKLQLRFKF
jgi:hypothetical protein